MATAQAEIFDDPGIEPEEKESKGVENLAIEEPVKDEQTEQSEVATQETEQQEEAQTETQAQNQTEEKTKTVDYETYDNVKVALKAERKEREKLNSKLDAQTQQLSQLMGLKGELEEWRKTQNKEQQSSEDEEFETNPAQYLKNKIDELQHQTTEQQQQSTQERQQTEAFQAEMSEIAQSTAAFSQEKQDYGDAMQYMEQYRYKEYELAGIPKEHWQQQFTSESIAFARNQKAMGNNPAEMAYKFAEHYGYAPNQTEQTQTQPRQETPQGGSNTNKKPSIADIERQQQASQSLSEGGSADETYLKKIAEMSPDEFDKHWKKIEQDAYGAENVF